MNETKRSVCETIKRGVNETKRDEPEQVPPRFLIGVVGPIGSGKTTMIEKTFGVQIRNERDGYTEDIEFYNLENNIQITDFPGSDNARDKVRNIANGFLVVPDAFIVLLYGAGSSTCTHTTSCIDIVKRVAEIGRPYIIVFTQMDKCAYKNANLQDLEHHKECLSFPLMKLAVSEDQEIPRFWVASFRPDIKTPTFLQHEKSGFMKGSKDILDWINVQKNKWQKLQK